MLNSTFEYVNALRNKYTTLDNVCVYSCVCVCYLTMHSIYLLLMVITQLGCCMLLEGGGGGCCCFVCFGFAFCEVVFFLGGGYLGGFFVVVWVFWGGICFYIIVLGDFVLFCFSFLSFVLLLQKLLAPKPKSGVQCLYAWLSPIIYM